MDSLSINSSTFDSFGKISYCQIPSNDINLIIDVNHSDNKIDLFKNICIDILKSQIEFNLLAFRNLVFHLTNENPKLVDEILIIIFDEITITICQEIKTSIKNNTFSVNYFIDIYNKYYRNSQFLIKYLSYFDNNIIKDTQNKYSHISLIRNFMFYKNIINNKYECMDDKELYLYEIFTKYIENNNVQINEIIKLFKMYSFYIRLSFVPKENRDSLFNLEINKLFLVTLGSNKEFIKNIVQYIHNGIKSINNKNDDEIFNNILELINLVSNHINEKYMFNLYYEKLYEIRLLSQEFNSEIEKKIITKFKRPDDNKIIQNMLYKLDDIDNSKTDKIIYEKLQVTIKSDKYKGKITIDQLNRKMINPKVFRYYAWSYSKDEDKDDLIIPFELSPYIDIFNEYYKTKYPYRNLTWNFNLGIGIIKLTLGNKTYQLQLATPQLFLLIQFNDKSQISATDLASYLGISMAKLGPILNSLLMAHILKREENKSPTDPSMLIYLNNDFKYENEKISLVNLMNNDQLQQKKIEEEINDKFSIGRDTILQAKIIREMKLNKHLLYTQLLEKTKMSLLFDLNENKFNEILELCVKENYIHKNNDNSYDYLEESNDN